MVLEAGIRRQFVPPCLGALAALALALGAGCGEGGEGAGYPGSQLSVQEATAPLTDAPPRLREIRAQANQLLGGGLEAFEARLAELRGLPVVVNRWASWCGPCIDEFPHFQEVASELGDEVAFLGLDTDDGEEAAATFLERLPVPYPSYFDPDKDLARSLAADYPPTTVLIDASGEVAHRKIGQYTSADDLRADIERYAMAP